MNYFRLYGLVGLCILLFQLSLLGQNAQPSFKLAQKEFKLERYRRVVNILNQLPEKQQDPKYHFMLGRAYLHIYSFDKGLHHLRTAEDVNPKVDKHLDYWLARGWHLNEGFDTAIVYYTRYAATIKNENDLRKIECQKHIKECQNGIELKKNPGNYTIKNLGPIVNSEYSEHSPLITQDGRRVYFTARRHSGNQDEETDEYGEYLEDIYSSVRDSAGHWGTPEKIKLNTDGHDATVQLIEDKKMILYKSEGNGDIYESNMLSDSSWTEPSAVKKINSSFTETDAHYSADSSMVVFVSTRGVKDDDKDLYISYRDGAGEWSNPINLGEGINTYSDEKAPFITTRGNTLYFSSEGHNTMGGFDVFKAEYDSAARTWGKPENVGFPINTAGDDVYFYFTNANNWAGFFSSYRNGGYGEKDLYEVTFIPNVYVEGLIAELETDSILENTKVLFVSRQSGELVAMDTMRLQDGGYFVNIRSNETYDIIVLQNEDTLWKEPYKVVQLKEGDALHYTYNVKVRLPGRTYKTEEQKPNIDSNVVTPAGIAVNNDRKEKPFGIEEVKVGCSGILRNIYFEFNSAVIRHTPECSVELDNLLCLLKENPQIVVEISGHTDNVGSAVYNQRLSQRRAQAIVNWLMEKGVEKGRLKAMGYGEERPLASNDDEKEGRELNRRVEFKVIGTTALADTQD